LASGELLNTFHQFVTNLYTTGLHAYKNGVVQINTILQELVGQSKNSKV
jgi:hypothetical protein